MNTGNRDQGIEIREQGTGSRAAGGFEATLRLIAQLPAPQGLADRVQSGLRAAPASGRILRWPAALKPGRGWTQSAMQSAMQSAPARMAAAAAIVFAVIGGGWGVASRVHPAQPIRAVVLPPRMNAPAGFSSAGAMRTPQTLNRPIVAHATAAELQAVQAAEQTADKAAAEKSLRHSKSTTARKVIAHPTAPATQ